jgi:hypothetical protein
MISKSIVKSLIFATIALVACKKDEEISSKEAVIAAPPATYSFTRDGVSSVSFGGQQDRIGMLNEISSIMKDVNVSGGTINATDLKAKFANQGATWLGTYGSSKNLKGKCFGLDSSYFDNLIDEMANVASANKTASNGTAGFLAKEGSNEGYLLNENGLEYRQIFVKRVMGSAFFNQSIENYLGQGINIIDNTAIVAGKNYTQMEHHYDEAFGYLGIATDLSNADLEVEFAKGQFWGEYLIKRTAASEYKLTGGNEAMLQAFIEGRFAVEQKDMSARNAAIKNIGDTWGLLIGLNAAAYLDKAMSDTDEAAKFHHLSEAVAFMLCLQYHRESSEALYNPIYSQAKVTAALNLVGLNTNFYQVSNTDIQAALTELSNAFAGELVK